MTAETNVPSSDPIRVLCVDDNSEVLRALQFMLSRMPGLAWAGGLTSTRELSGQVEASEVDVQLLDYSVPGESTLDALRELKREHPAVGCIVFSGYSEPEFVEQALGAGAARCMPKDADLDELVEAIRGLGHARGA